MTHVRGRYTNFFCQLFLGKPLCFPIVPDSLAYSIQTEQMQRLQVIKLAAYSTELCVYCLFDILEYLCYIVNISKIIERN